MLTGNYDKLSQRNKELVYAYVKDLGLEGHLGGLQFIHPSAPYEDVPNSSSIKPGLFLAI